MGCKLTNTSWVSMVTLTIAIHAVINNTTVPEGNISLEIQYRTSERLNDWCLTYLRYGKNKCMYD
jgi:hypothetical protein